MTTPLTPHCILLARIDDAPELFKRLGQNEGLHVVDRCLNRMTRSAAAFGGRVVKEIGQELIQAFDDADHAVQAACDMQQRVSALPPAAGIQLALRVVVHGGALAEAENDLYGEVANQAERLLARCSSGQVLASSYVADRLTESLHQQLYPADRQSIEQQQGVIRAYDIHWTGGPHPMAALPAGHAPETLRMRLTCGEQMCMLDGNKTRAAIGRDASCDLVIEDPKVSRFHARIERRDGRWIVVDSSTNGTYVTLDGEAETRLHSDFLPLLIGGFIHFGLPRRAKARQPCVRFELLA